MSMNSTTRVNNLKYESSANSTLPNVQNASTLLNSNELSLTVNGLPNSTIPTVSSVPPDSQALTSPQPYLGQQIGQPATQQEIVNALPNSSSSVPPDLQVLTSQQPYVGQQRGQHNMAPNGFIAESNIIQPITILQALDNNNQPIINDSTTTSNSIVLHLLPNENVPIYKVQCFIDNSPIVPCSNNLVVLDH